MKESVSNELSDVEHELARPTEDPYTGEKSTFRATDPELFLERLAYLRVDFLNKIKDPELRKELGEKILKTEQKVYRQFIPFIESRINIFGWQNSPLAEYTPHHKLSTEEIQFYFEQARTILKHLKVSEEEQIDFSTELERLQEKMERYRSEPTLFTFEKIQEELQKELSDINDEVFSIEPREALKVLEDGGARKEN